MTRWATHIVPPAYGAEAAADVAHLARRLGMPVAAMSFPDELDEWQRVGRLMRELGGVPQFRAVGLRDISRALLHVAHALRPPSRSLPFVVCVGIEINDARVGLAPSTWAAHYRPMIEPARMRYPDLELCVSVQLEVARRDGNLAEWIESVEESDLVTLHGFSTHPWVGAGVMGLHADYYADLDVPLGKPRIITECGQPTATGRRYLVDVVNGCGLFELAALWTLVSVDALVDEGVFGEAWRGYGVVSREACALLGGMMG